MERLHKKQEPNICFQKEIHFKYKTQKQVNNERVKKTFHTNSNFMNSNSHNSNYISMYFVIYITAKSPENFLS